MSDVTMNQTTTTALSTKGYPLLSADQIRPLFDAVGEAVKNYSEEDEERTGDAVISAQDRIANARTVDPLGIAYKLRATRSWRDQSKGLAQDLKSPDQTARTIATIIRDAEAASANAARRSTRSIPSRLRPLWDAYQGAWKAVCAADDVGDAGRLALAREAFDGATEAFEEAPTRTVDDALCRIEYALDQVPAPDIAEALNAALRVLRKARIEA